MPTTQPRYTVTDTGEMRDMLDLAHERWPDVADRRQLLFRLAGAGARQVAHELDTAGMEARRARQREALRRAADLVDEERLLSDSAWR